MTRWSREQYLLVLAYIGAALVMFVLGVSVVLAAGHSVPAAFWTVGGALLGILTGMLLPGREPVRETRTSGATRDEPSATGGDRDEPAGARSGGGASKLDDAVQSTGDRSWSTPRGVVVGLAAVAAVVLALGVLLYAGEVDLADALILIASAAAGALVGIYVPRPEPPQTLAKSASTTATEGRGKDDRTTGTTKDGGDDSAKVTTTPGPISPGIGLPAALAAVGIVVLLGTVALLFSLLPRATVKGAQIFHGVSLFLIVVTVGLAVAAFTGPAEKRQRLRQGLVAGAVLTAVLAFVSNTASGLVVDRFTSHPTGSGIAVAVKAYLTSPAAKNYFSAKVAAPRVKVELGSECTVYLVHLDELVDDEPHIADHLPGKSFPLDQGAQACHLKRPSEVDALAAVLAKR
jgi:hypothetical protein